MAVLFALLVVAVIAVAVVVAVRDPRAGLLEEPTSDRPPTTVPSGQLTGADLRAVRFPVVFRGYRPDDVEALLDRLSVQLDAPHSSPTASATDSTPETPTHQENVDEAPPA